MFIKIPHRNWEWFEDSFFKKLTILIKENSKNNYIWIRDAFFSLFLSLFPIFLNSIKTLENSKNISSLINCAFYISIFLLILWFFLCTLRYNKIIKKIKNRIIPHSIKDYYTIEECVHLFDNEICNNIVLTKEYFDLSSKTKEQSLKEFYLIEGVFYYYKSIRYFNQIILSVPVENLISEYSSFNNKINIIRIQNYLNLIDSTKINFSTLDKKTSLNIQNYIKTFNVTAESFNETCNRLSKLKNITSDQSIIELKF